VINSDTPARGVSPEKIKRALAWSALNSVLLRLGNFASGIVVARIVAKEAFGIFAVALTVQAILSAVADLGLSADLIRGGRIRERAGTATTLALASTGLLALGMVVTARPVSRMLGSVDAAPVVMVMALTLLLQGLSVVPYSSLQREFRQSAALAIDATSLVVNTVLTVVFLLLGAGAMALAIARVISQALVCVMQYALCRTLPRIGFRGSQAASMIRFGGPVALANLLSVVVMNVDYIVVGATGGALMLASYVLAFNVSSWPMTALSQVLRSTALPGFAQISDKLTRSRQLVRALGLSWAAALLVGCMLSVLADAVIQLVYGDKWSVAAEALVGLALFGSVRLVFDLFATFLYAVGVTRPVLYTQVIWLATIAPAMTLAVRWWGLAGAGWAHVVIAVVCVLPAYGLALRRAGIAVRDIGMAVLTPTVAAIPAVALGIVAKSFIDGRLAELIVSGGVMAGVFAAMLWPWLAKQVRNLHSAADSPAGASTLAVVPGE
jgi:PST family polysaccharide transporter